MLQMAASNKSVCLCVLMGLPASGKTSLTKQLKAYYSTSDFVHVISITFDDYLSIKIRDHSIMNKDYSISEDFIEDCKTLTPTLSSISSKHTTDTDSKHSTWKEDRQYISKLVENCVLYLLGLSQPYVAEYDRAGRKPDLCPCFNYDYSFLLNKSHVIIIDDNMFYRSMRYSFYQLARRFRIAYCQVYLKIKIEDALKRNADRGSTVTSDTISKMSFLFEEPDLLVNHWEKQTLCLNGDDNDESLHNIVSFIDVSFQNIAQFCGGDDKVVCTFSKEENLKNCYHQIDILLRKYITTEMIRMKTMGILFQNQGNLLNKKRKLFFSALKNSEGFYDCTGLLINLNEVAGDVLNHTLKEKVIEAFLHFNLK